ncbi:MAG: LysR family transcriptional regulator [Bacteroidales bacterium]|nr:LysR family transcriptional regulator [Bacteroidales bacterium]
MTLQQLRYIVSIDQFRHFGKAAEAHGLTQSTLSLMVKKLEEELDVQIFDRQEHPVAPTQIGRRIIDKAKVILYNVNQLTDMTLSEKERLSGPLKLAMISTVAPVLVPGLFKYMGQHCPDISLSTEEMLSQTLISKLEKAELDMGFLPAPVDDPNLLIIPLYTEKFFAYISPAEAIHDQQTVTNALLRMNKGWVMHNGLQMFRESMLAPGEQPSYEKFYEGSRVGTLVQMVNENGGFAIIPETHIALIRAEHRANLRPIVSPELTRTIVLAIRRDYIHEAKLNAVLAAIRTIIPAPLLSDLARREHISI